MSDWPHAPVHRFSDGGIYFVTGATLYKQHFFRRPRSLDALQELLFETAREQAVSLQAWCLFSNHYHLVATAEEGACIKNLLTSLHVDSAKAMNRFEDRPGRRIWYQFRETQLTYERCGSPVSDTRTRTRYITVSL